MLNCKLKPTTAILDKTWTPHDTRTKARGEKLRLRQKVYFRVTENLTLAAHSALRVCSLVGTDLKVTT